MKYAKWAEQHVTTQGERPSKIRLLHEAILFYAMSAAQNDQKSIEKTKLYASQKLEIENLFNEGEELFKKKDFSEAFPLLKKVAEKGHLKAKFLTAQIYEKFRNKKEAKKLYEELSSFDDPEAMCALARLSREDEEETEGIKESKEKDIYEAEILLKKAIYLEYPLAYFDLGLLYTVHAHHLVKEGATAIAAKYFHEAILCFKNLLDYVRQDGEHKRPVYRQYEAEANFNLSLLYKWNGRRGETREYAKAAAALDHPQGLYNYGILLAEEDQDMESRKMILKAAELGLSEAQVTMAKSEAARGNIVKAAKWYQQAKFNHYPNIENSLKDFLEEQFRKYNPGSDEKDKDACFVLGVLYKVQENPRMAKKCLKISAHQKHGGGAFELGVLYEEQGNIRKALHWQEQGVTAGAEALAHWACLLYMNQLSNQDKVKALKGLGEVIEKGYLSGYIDLARRLEAAGRKEKAEIFYKKDRKLKLKLAGTNS